jgi:hypothetical protein
MALTQSQFNECLDTLFDQSANSKDDNRILKSVHAYQFLTMEYVDQHTPLLKNHIKFDNIKAVMMIKRFYRDAFGVGAFHSRIEEWIKEGGIHEKLKSKIHEELDGLGIRINSSLPKKTRIAAAFSLWATTFRPLILDTLPNAMGNRPWHLDALVSFWIAGSYLRRFGVVRIGDPTKDKKDADARLGRILYDFTYRDLNLSSLEFMYAFIFIPFPPEKTENLHCN